MAQSGILGSSRASDTQHDNFGVQSIVQAILESSLVGAVPLYTEIKDVRSQLGSQNRAPCLVIGDIAAIGERIPICGHVRRTFGRSSLTSSRKRVPPSAFSINPSGIAPQFMELKWLHQEPLCQIPLSSQNLNARIEKI